MIFLWFDAHPPTHLSGRKVGGVSFFGGFATLCRARRKRSRPALDALQRGDRHIVARRRWRPTPDLNAAVSHLENRDRLPPGPTGSVGPGDVVAPPGGKPEDRRQESARPLSTLRPFPYWRVADVAEHGSVFDTSAAGRGVVSTGNVVPLHRKAN